MRMQVRQAYRSATESALDSRAQFGPPRPECTIAELCPAAGEEDRIRVIKVLQQLASVMVSCRTIGADVPLQQAFGLCFEVDRLRFAAQAALVAHQGRDANVHAPPAPVSTSGQAQNLVQACA